MENMEQEQGSSAARLLRCPLKRIVASVRSLCSERHSLSLMKSLRKQPYCMLILKYDALMGYEMLINVMPF